MARVTVVDYDCGNLFSVRHAFEHCGATVEFASTPEAVAAAELLVLPGVGAFGDACTKLHDLGLFEPVREFPLLGRQLLGICVGMQLLFDASEEFGHHQGLGLIPGDVTALPATTVDGQFQKVPHIGWSEIVPASAATRWEGTLLEGLDRPLYGYFVHSFAARPRRDENRLGDCIVGGHAIAALVGGNGVWGCQFHPEKSGPQGLRILANFLNS